MLGRSLWIDRIRGAAIILVVAGHTLRGLYSADIIPEETFGPTDMRIYAFHMPVFFVLSGWYYLRSLAQRAPLAVFKSKISRILWPLVIWTFLFQGLKLAAGRAANQPIDLSSFQFFPLPPVDHLWFLWALFVIQVAVIPVKICLNKPGGHRMAIAYVAIGVALLNIFPISHVANGLFAAAIRFSPFFLLGMVLGESKQLPEKAPELALPAAVIFGMLILIYPFLLENGHGFMATVLLTLSFACIWAAKSLNARSSGGQILVLLGQTSMAIYLTHTIFSAAIRIALLKWGITDAWSHILLGTVFGLVGGVLSFQVAKRLRLVRVLGF